MISGEVYHNGKFICEVWENGDIYRNGTFLGSIRDSGDIYHNGEYLCHITPGGDIYRNGTFLAHIDSSGDIYHNGRYLGHYTGRLGSEKEPEADSDSDDEPIYPRGGSSGFATAPEQHTDGGDLFLLPGAFFGLIAAFWPALLVCFVLGLLLAFLTRAVRATGAVYAATEPHTLWIALAGAVGLVLLVWRRVERLNRGCGWMAVAGSILVFLSATWFAAYRFGLIAVWAFPADFAGREEYHQLLQAGFAGCPGAQAVFGWFQRVLTGSSRIPLDHGLGGVLGGIETAARGFLDGRLPVLLALLLYLLTIPAGFLIVLVFVFIVPPVCLLIPFVPGIALVLILGKLLSIGLK